MTSVGQVLQVHRGLGPGFDLLRHVMAVSVVAWHGSAVVLGDLAPRGRFLELTAYGVLAAFFVLGGFLITASAERLRMSDFLVNRLLRIVPALSVEVLLCAFILGPIFTTLTLKAYFSDPQTYQYLTNIVALVNYQLPGVFKSNPSDIINVTLWTVPHEAVSYVILCSFVLLGALRRPLIVALFALAFTLFGVAAFAIGTTGDLAGRIVEKIFVGEASRLYMGFLMGALAYLYRDRIPYSRGLLVLSVLTLGAIGFLDIQAREDLPVFPMLNILALPAITYITVHLGISNLWGSRYFKRADYSYGIYLYGWPLQQMLVASLPGLRDPTLNVILVLPLVIVFAMLSWHLVEKPVLRFRKNLSFIAKHRLEDRPDKPAVQTAGGIAPPAMPAGAGRS